MRDTIWREDAIETAQRMYERCNTGDIIDYRDMVVEALKVLPSAQPQWIPVTERLPLKPGFYMVTVGAPHKPVRVYEYNPCEGYENENLWKGSDGSYCFNWFVEAWCELPEPWKGCAE